MINYLSSMSLNGHFYCITHSYLRDAEFEVHALQESGQYRWKVRPVGSSVWRITDAKMAISVFNELQLDNDKISSEMKIAILGEAVYMDMANTEILGMFSQEKIDEAIEANRQFGESLREMIPKVIAKSKLTLVE